MSAKVFYAWQSDRHQNAHRFLIRDALRLAIERLNSNAEVQSARRAEAELDHDTKGETGTPAIARTIMRKIRHATAFVADVTFVADYSATDGRPKRTPNPNVMIELGVAVRRPGWSRILLVMNSAWGKPEDLPFDIKEHSHPVQYDLPDGSDKATKKAAMKKLADRLGVMLKPIIDAADKPEAASERQARQAEEEAKRQRADARWATFTDRFAASDFHRMQVGVRFGRTPTEAPTRSAHAALGIVPLVPLANPLDIPAIRYKNPSGMEPMRTSSWFTDQWSKSYTHSDRGRNGEPATTVVELNHDGAIFAAVEVPGGKTLDGEQAYPLERVQRELIERVSRYANFLRSLGVAGPLRVWIMIEGMKGALLRPNDTFHWNVDRLRPLKDEFLIVGPVTLPDEADASGSVAKAFREAFTNVWLDAGMDCDPCYNADGTLSAER
jgi:hypothetical protein